MSDTTNGKAEIMAARPSPIGDVMTPENVLHQVNLIQRVMAAAMQDGQHYGTIPGTNSRKTLLKPGAEKLCMTFRLAPTYDVRRFDLPNGHREYEVVCTLTQINSGQVWGQGLGLCSSAESKYRWRTGERKCPKCDKPSIIKGKAEYGGGWICFAKKGGCGAKFADRDPQIEGQPTGRAEHPDIADTFNTVLKMAKKRALIDGVLSATAASDMFTQDIGDHEPDDHHAEPEERPEPKLAPKAAQLLQQCAAIFADYSSRWQQTAAQVAGNMPDRERLLRKATAVLEDAYGKSMRRDNLEYLLGAVETDAALLTKTLAKLAEFRRSLDAPPADEPTDEHGEIVDQAEALL